MPPAGRVRGLLEPFGYGRGWQEIQRIDNPAAGASFAFPIAGIADTRLLSLAFRLVTDANPANRTVELQYDDGNGGLFAVEGPGLVVTASTTQDFAASYRRGVAEWAAGTRVFFPLPDLFLEGGNIVRIQIGNVQVGDQLSRIMLCLERYPSGRQDYPEGRAVAPPR